MAVLKGMDERCFLSQTIIPASIRKVGIPFAAGVVVAAAAAAVVVVTGYAVAFAVPVASMEAVAWAAVEHVPSAAVVAGIQVVCSTFVGSATSVVFEATSCWLVEDSFVCLDSGPWQLPPTVVEIGYVAAVVVLPFAPRRTSCKGPWSCIHSLPDCISHEP